MASPQWLFVCQSAPFTDALAIAGLDAVMAAGAFGQQTSVLFTGRGVEQLLAVSPPPEGQRDVRKTLAGLSLYDVDNVYVDGRDWAASETNSAALPVKPLTSAEIQALIAASTHVVSF